MKKFLCVALMASLVFVAYGQSDKSKKGLASQAIKDQKAVGTLHANKLNAYVIPKSNNVFRGGEYEAQIILAAEDTTQRMEYYVDGVKLGNDGVYKVNASTIGKKSYDGIIVFQNGGESIKLPFEGEYIVSEPEVIIANNEANVMYCGYGNKFTISVPGVSDDRVQVSVNGASSRKQSKEWIIRPSEGAKTVTINVSAEINGKWQLIGSREYRVKPLPTPTASFVVNDKEYTSGNIVPKNLLNTSGMIVASYGPDGELNIPFKVIRFRATINGQRSDSFGNKFTETQLNQIDRLKIGSTIIFEEIHAIGPDGKDILLSPMVLTVN